MTKRILLILLLACISFGESIAQNATIENIVSTYLRSYKVEGYRPHDTMRADSVIVNDEGYEIRIFPNEPFCSQQFTPQNVKRIYAELQRSLPSPYNTFRLFVLDKKQRLIEDLIPNIYREENADASRLWGKIDYKGLPWVTNASLPYRTTEGLQGRHLFLWPSHGRYYKNGRWQWQRPYIYCTTEDLFTQSFVFPFLMPMLEKAGAIVCSPRERDYQTHEAVVDYDAPMHQGVYGEASQDDAKWVTSPDSTGFAPPLTLLNDNIHPFSSGTYRMTNSVSRRNSLSLAQWMPDIPQKGRYAVYVSYASRPNSIPDAAYTVYHKGGKTTFYVNQQMGGGTWVYLGTFEFDKGKNNSGRVVLSNHSKHRGVVTADAVRFGGGMGQTERCSAGTSGLPRYLEAARYYSAWAGVPDTLVNTEAGADDYKDDLRTRSHMLNYLGGGSVYLPGYKGQNVPFELSLAVHSDAGVNREGGVYGSLAISTSYGNDGETEFTCGVSREASSDFARLLLGNLTSDLSNTFHTDWFQREHWDRNYAETRMPGVPSAILETMSHQNFRDMSYGHDPLFKFALARSVYKSILRFVSFQHGIKKYTVQPLPVHAFSAMFTDNENEVRLSWKETKDSIESSARPDGYVLYTKIDGDDFDNGMSLGNVNEYKLNIQAGHTYAFRITAVNAGGESFPSETLSVYRSTSSRAKTILVVNAFDRLSGPATVETADSLGFDLKRDMGVPYMSTTAFAGSQRNFDVTAMGREGSSGLGYSGYEYMGKNLKGNTFDFTLSHGKSISLAGYSYCSTSREAFDEQEVSAKTYAAIDYIAGLQANKPYNHRLFKVFTSSTRNRLKRYLERGGSLLLSGSYIASDNQTKAEKQFTEEVLKYRYDGSAYTDSTNTVRGLNLRFSIYRTPNEEHYAAQEPDALLPASSQAFSAFGYGGGQGAGVAYSGKDYHVVSIGFPFECIQDADTRNRAMNALLQFLTSK